ncbi:hypothetical protein [Streptomyces sp. NRRL S-1824]|uniref:hypothetical protein n=1 Tax=Streptomyces sp. NRRL S-1824 TaxID=1463889 RepID=UPI002D21AFC6|nr:hypothetical protein [Streptomyces sp. NRRL S-1824]
MAERTFVTSFGVEAELTRSDVDVIAAQLRPGGLVQLSGYGMVMPVNGPLLSRFTALVIWRGKHGPGRGTRMSLCGCSRCPR